MNLTIQTTHLGGSSSVTFDEYNISLFCVGGENLDKYERISKLIIEICDTQFTFDHC